MSRIGSRKLLLICSVWLILLSMGGAAFRILNPPPPGTIDPPPKTEPLKSPEGPNQAATTDPPRKTEPLKSPEGPNQAGTTDPARKTEPLKYREVPNQTALTYIFYGDDLEYSRSNPRARGTYENALTDLLKILREQPRYVLEIRANASAGDPSGDEKAKKRAANVRQDLVNLGATETDLLQLRIPPPSAEEGRSSVSLVLVEPAP